MREKGFIPLIGLVLLLMLSGTAIAGYVYFNKSNPPVETVTSLKNSTSPTQATDTAKLEAPVAPVPSDSCSGGCQALMDAKIAQLKKELLAVISKSPTPGSSVILPNPTSPPSQNQTTSQPKEIYLYFGVNGSTQSMSWTDIAGTQINFNPSNYPGAKGFYFQANLQSDAPDRTVYARIYDATHTVGVQGSDIEYTGLTSTLKESSSLTFLSGSISLKTQIKSLVGNLATVSNPRIKIVY